MIIGMLALSNREILKDKIDVMLKVGLGPLAKVMYITCIHGVSHS